MESYELSKDAAVRIAKAVRQVEDMTFSPRGPMRQQGQPVPVKGWYKIVTNEGAGKYTIKRQAWDEAAGALIDLTDVHNPEYGWYRTAWDVRAFAGGRPGYVAAGWPTWVNGEWYTQIEGATGRVFPITLAQTGGAQGTNAAAATWTYTVTDTETGEALGAAVDPTAAPHLWRRRSLGQMSVATAGLSHRTAAGVLVIDWTNEANIEEAC